MEKIKLPKQFKFVGPPPREYQKRAFVYAVTRDDAGILLDVGTGKTKVAIDVARFHIQYDNIQNVLVVCPTSLLYNWKQEIEKFSEYNAVTLDKPKNVRNRILQSSSFMFAIVNYEMLFPILRDFDILDVVKTKKGRKRVVTKEVNNIDKIKYDMVIFDESAKYLKNHTTQRSRASIIFSDAAKYHLILTATLIGNKPLNIWPQFRCLDCGRTFGTNPYSFRNYFFYTIDRGRYKEYKLRKKKIATLHNKIYSKCIRFSKAECIDLPEQMTQTLRLTMPKSLARSYSEAQEKIIAELDTVKGRYGISILGILAQLTKLQQITSGFASDGKGTEVQLVETPKLDACIEEIETIVEADESVVIWCKFIFSIDMISKQLKKKKIKHVTLDGRVTNKKEKYNRWKGFQKSKTVNVFIGQMESGGLGIELFKLNSREDQTQHTIVYENPWGPDVREQMFGRTHRSGQKSTCRYVDLIIRDTIDERILNTVNMKQKVADAIMIHGVADFLKGDKDESKN